MDLKIGQSASLTKAFTEQEVSLFADLSLDKNELHAAMKAVLPIFMIPGYLRQIDNIVLNKNGKIDRRKTIEQLGGAGSGSQP